MRDIFLNLDTLESTIRQVQEQVRRERTNFSKLVNKVVEIAQEARINKDYALADALREVLKQSQIETIQGTPEYATFADIPTEKVGMPIIDTWRFIK